MVELLLPATTKVKDEPSKCNTWTIYSAKYHTRGAIAAYSGPTYLSPQPTLLCLTPPSPPTLHYHRFVQSVMQVRLASNYLSAALLTWNNSRIQLFQQSFRIIPSFPSLPNPTSSPTLAYKPVGIFGMEKPLLAVFPGICLAHHTLLFEYLAV